MQEEIKDLENQRESLAKKIADTKERDDDRERAEGGKHAEETDAIKKANATLKEHLEGILSAPKKLP
jgi:predicted  nucleic acid-binding Zn-ribbon protein